jgi:predicted alpha/beta-hydrolase family hydrolase
MTAAVWSVETPVGEARLVGDLPKGRARALLVLGHGAGGGIEARDLATLARELPPDGFAVIRVEQPWRTAGKRVAGPPPQLDKAWLACVPEAVRLTGVTGPLVVGGRSAGARVACRTAGAVGAAGVVALAFPLHPPGRPDRSRVAELLSVEVPVLVVQGDRDSFGGPAELPDGTRVVAVPGADHGFRVPASGPLTQAAALALVVGAVRDFVGMH